MPIQYQPLPEFQVPNLNLMGSFAQGAALVNQQLQQEKLAQATDIAAATAAQNAEAARIKQQADELDFAVKNANTLASATAASFVQPAHVSATCT